MKFSTSLKFLQLEWMQESLRGYYIEENKVGTFLEKTNNSFHLNYSNSELNYRERALHSYTLLSSDSQMLKESIYDDTILFILSKSESLSKSQILEGSNKTSSANALGAGSWSDFNILLEPTIAIPYICSHLFKGYVNSSFNSAVSSIYRAKKIGAKLFITFFYINECASHLLRDRKYYGLDLDENELVFSNNAFVSNYYALKQKGCDVPNDFMDYLAIYSSSIRTEKYDI